jgi:flagellar biosynthesis protein FlhF
MQVKKFEARTMKEALEMVKTQLGPDAIILSARDNNKSFGLVGEGSVEITAAVSEETLHRKKFVESRMRVEDKDKLNRSSAKIQKHIIDKMVTKYIDEKEAAVPKKITRTRYIEIDDDVESSQNLASERVKSAAERAWSSMQNQVGWLEEAVSAPKAETRQHARQQIAQNRQQEQQQLAPQPRQQQQQAQTQVQQSESPEILALKNEIANLKQVLNQFQRVPQTFVNQHPGAEFGLSYDVSSIYEKLVNSGIASEIAAEMLMVAQEKMTPAKLKNKALVDGWTAKYILDHTVIANDKLATKVQLFVGPAGSGKTSSLIKLASHYVVREHKKVALVTADTYKVGAADQMRIYAQILNVPFAIVRQKSDWDKIMAQLSSYDHILVDFPGLTLKTMEEISAVRNLIPPEKFQPQTHLVLSCLAKDADLTEMGKRYRTAGFQDVIFTGLDESNQQGTIYNFMKRFQTPLHSFGVGTRVPEDFEMATKERVLDLIFKITQLKQQDAQG